MKNRIAISVFRAELLKYRKSPALFLTIGAPLFLASVVFLIFFFKADKLIASPEIASKEYFGSSLNFLSLLIPLYLILLNIFVFNIEYKSNTFKTLFTLPVKRSSIIIAKFFAVLLMFFGSAVILQVLLYLGFKVNSIKHVELFSFSNVYFIESTLVLLQMLVASLIIMGLQFYFSFKWKNIVVAMSIGIMGFISYLILIQGWEYIVYHPYAFPTLIVKNTMLSTIVIADQLWYSLVGLAAIFVFVLLEVGKRKVVD